jgi:atypical dual specificity phosphatase
VPHNFSFVIPGQLAGMGQPGGLGSYLQADLARLREAGIGAMVSLTPEPPEPKAVAAAGLTLLHLPIEDFGIPTDEQIDRLVAFAGEQIAAGQAVVVHCGAGMGRTGTVLACYLVHLGEGADEAIDSIRRIRPGSIETAEQAEFVRAYQKRCGSEKPRRSGGRQTRR